MQIEILTNRLVRYAIDEHVHGSAYGIVDQCSDLIGRAVGVRVGNIVRREIDARKCKFNLK